MTITQEKNMTCLTYNLIVSAGSIVLTLLAQSIIKIIKREMRWQGF